MILKHINDLVIGDEILVEIPTVCWYVSKVIFINKELNFIFLEGNVDDDFNENEDASGIKFTPDKDGYFKVP